MGEKRERERPTWISSSSIHGRDGDNEWLTLNHSAVWRTADLNTYLKRALCLGNSDTWCGVKSQFNHYRGKSN